MLHEHRALRLELPFDRADAVRTTLLLCITILVSVIDPRVGVYLSRYIGLYTDC